MGFQQGLAGLNVSSKSLEVIGNNVANANTYGAKTARAEFSDMYAASLAGGGSNNIGIGARIATVAQQFTQGNIKTTENPLDIAINGDGFFMVQRWDTVSGTDQVTPAGEELYSRNGQFKVDKNGYITNNNDHKLLGTDRKPIQLDLSGGSAKSTSLITMSINLDAAASTDDAFTVTSGTPTTGTYSFSTTQTLYDPSGEAVPIDYYFRKSGVDEWQAYGMVNGKLISSSTAPTFTIRFDPATSSPISITDSAGTQYTGTSMAAVPLPTIPAGTSSSTQSDISATIDLSKVTEYAGKSNVNELTQDGYTKGDFSSFAIDPKGAILVRYTNGQTVPGGTIGLASFRNPQGLQPVGGNEWSQTSTSGAAQRGKPSDNKTGLLQGGALEESNVDLTGELVNMIVAQRTYQANAQTIKTEDQVLQTLVNLR